MFALVSVINVLDNGLLIKWRDRDGMGMEPYVITTRSKPEAAAASLARRISQFLRPSAGFEVPQLSLTSLG
jgi:hypothetical protein